MIFAEMVTLAFLIVIASLNDVFAGAAGNKDLPGRHLIFRSGVSSSGDKSIIAAKGDTIELQCELLTSEWSNAQWLIHQTKDGIEDTVPLASSLISREDYLSIVTLKNVNGEEEGNYSCVLIRLGNSNPFKFQVHIKSELACTQDTCRSRGNCSEVVDGYSCQCEAGYIGTSCEMRDRCSNSPCQNGGTCINLGEGFNCTCVTGFGGDNCESEVCTPNVCGRSGTCSVKNNTIQCRCNYNHAGDRCQYRCDMRTNSRRYYRGYCRYNNRWTCKISLTRYGQDENCVCDQVRQSSGNRCMMETDVRNECADPNICNGNGYCNDQVLGYRCDCHGNYHGTNCEFYNECGSSRNLCIRFGGSCVDLTDGYECRNCPEGQHGDKCQYKKDICKVTCYGHSMTAECDTRFMNSKMRTIPVYLNSKKDSCQLPTSSGWYRRITVGYTACGTENEFAEDFVVYRNTLRVGVSGKTHEGADAIITRNVGHFSFEMECSLPLVRNASKGLTELSLMSNETMDLQDHERIGVSGTNVEFYRADYSSRISNYVVGDRLYVKMTITTASNPTLSGGYTLYPISCFATPSMNVRQERYMLLDDGCIVDESFRFENASRYRSDKRQAFFSFNSFSFKSNPGKLYLHCTSLACVNSKSETECGVTCDKADNQSESQTTISPRFRRNETIATANPKVMPDSSNDRQPGSSVQNLHSTIAKQSG